MKITRMALTATAAILLAGCTAQRSQEPARTPFSEKDADALAAQVAYLRSRGENAAADEKAKEAADRYARIGELLLMPEGFEYADEMFAKALALDPANAKAAFYKAVTEPLMTFRGVIPRFERLLTDERDSRELERAREQVRRLKMPEVTRFAEALPAGERPFVTYYDLQRFQREKLLPALVASHERLGRIDLSAGPLQLNFTPERLSPDPVRRSSSSHFYSSSCAQDPTEGWKCQQYSSGYDYEQPKMRNQYFVDQHDLTAIRSIYAAYVDQIRLGTAYSFKDSEYALRRLKAVDSVRRESGRGGLSARDVVEVLREFPDLLALERDHQLAELARSSQQALKNGLELAALREELCEDRETRNDENSLFHPICLTAEAVDALQTGLELLAGPSSVVLGKDSRGRSVSIVMDLSRALQNPPKDLKALLPTRFDSKGEPLSYPDKTMGGLFPNGDLIDKLEDLGSSPAGRGSRKAMKRVRRAVRDAQEHI